MAANADDYCQFDIVRHNDVGGVSSPDRVPPPAPFASSTQQQGALTAAADAASPVIRTTNHNPFGTDSPPVASSRSLVSTTATPSTHPPSLTTFPPQGSRSASAASAGHAQSPFASGHIGTANPFAASSPTAHMVSPFGSIRKMAHNPFGPPTPGLVADDGTKNSSRQGSLSGSMQQPSTSSNQLPPKPPQQQFAQSRYLAPGNSTTTGTTLSQTATPARTSSSSPFAVPPPVMPPPPPSILSAGNTAISGIARNTSQPTSRSPSIPTATQEVAPPPTMPIFPSVGTIPVASVSQNIVDDQHATKPSSDAPESTKPAAAPQETDILVSPSPSSTGIAAPAISQLSTTATPKEGADGTVADPSMIQNGTNNALTGTITQPLVTTPSEPISQHAQLLAPQAPIVTEGLQSSGSVPSDSAEDPSRAATYTVAGHEAPDDATAIEDFKAEAEDDEEEDVLADLEDDEDVPVREGAESTVTFEAVSFAPTSYNPTPAVSTVLGVQQRAQLLGDGPGQTSLTSARAASSPMTIEAAANPNDDPLRASFLGFERDAEEEKVVNIHKPQPTHPQPQQEQPVHNQNATNIFSQPTAAAQQSVTPQQAADENSGGSGGWDDIADVAEGGDDEEVEEFVIQDGPASARGEGSFLQPKKASDGSATAVGQQAFSQPHQHMQSTSITGSTTAQQPAQPRFDNTTSAPKPNASSTQNPFGGSVGSAFDDDFFGAAQQPPVPSNPQQQTISHSFQPQQVNHQQYQQQTQHGGMPVPNNSVAALPIGTTNLQGAPQPQQHATSYYQQGNQETVQQQPQQPTPQNQPPHHHQPPAPFNQQGVAQQQPQTLNGTTQQQSHLVQQALNSTGTKPPSSLNASINRSSSASAIKVSSHNPFASSGGGFDGFGGENAGGFDDFAGPTAPQSSIPQHQPQSQAVHQHIPQPNTQSHHQPMPPSTHFQQPQQHHVTESQQQQQPVQANAQSSHQPPPSKPPMTATPQQPAAAQSNPFAAAAGSAQNPFGGAPGEAGSGFDDFNADPFGEPQQPHQQGRANDQPFNNNHPPTQSVPQKQFQPPHQPQSFQQRHSSMEPQHPFAAASQNNTSFGGQQQQHPPQQHQQQSQHQFQTAPQAPQQARQTSAGSSVTSTPAHIASHSMPVPNAPQTGFAPPMQHQPHTQAPPPQHQQHQQQLPQQHQIQQQHPPQQLPRAPLPTVSNVNPFGQAPAANDGFTSQFDDLGNGGAAEAADPFGELTNTINDAQPQLEDTFQRHQSANALLPNPSQHQPPQFQAQPHQQPPPQQLFGSQQAPPPTFFNPNQHGGPQMITLQQSAHHQGMQQLPQGAAGHNMQPPQQHVAPSHMLQPPQGGTSLHAPPPNMQQQHGNQYQHHSSLNASREGSVPNNLSQTGNTFTHDNSFGQPMSPNAQPPLPPPNAQLGNMPQYPHQGVPTPHSRQQSEGPSMHPSPLMMNPSQQSSFHPNAASATAPPPFLPRTASMSSVSAIPPQMAAPSSALQTHQPTYYNNNTSQSSHAKPLPYVPSTVRSQSSTNPMFMHQNAMNRGGSANPNMMMQQRSGSSTAAALASNTSMSGHQGAAGSAALFNVEVFLNARRKAPILSLGAEGTLIVATPSAPSAPHQLPKPQTLFMTNILQVLNPNISADPAIASATAADDEVSQQPQQPMPQPLMPHYKLLTTRVGRSYASLLNSAMLGSCTDTSAITGRQVAAALRKTSRILANAEGVRVTSNTAAGNSGIGQNEGVHNSNSTSTTSISRGSYLYELLARLCENNSNSSFDWYAPLANALNTSGNGGGLPSSSAPPATTPMGALDIAQVLGIECERTSALDRHRITALQLKSQQQGGNVEDPYALNDAHFKQNPSLWPSANANKGPGSPSAAPPMAPPLPITHALSLLPPPHLSTAPAPYREQECLTIVQQILAASGDRKEAVTCALYYNCFSIALLLSATLSPSEHSEVVARVVAASISKHTPLHDSLLLMNGILRPIGAPTVGGDAGGGGFGGCDGDGSEDPQRLPFPFGSTETAMATAGRAWAAHVQMVVASNSYLTPNALLQWGDYLLAQAERAFPPPSTFGVLQLKKTISDADVHADAEVPDAADAPTIGFSEIIEAAHFCFVVAQIHPDTRNAPSIVENLKTRFNVLGGLYARARCRAAIVSPQNIFLTEALEYFRQKEQLLSHQQQVAAQQQMGGAPDLSNAEPPSRYIRPQLLPYRIILGMLFAEVGLSQQAGRYIDFVQNVLPFASAAPNSSPDGPSKVFPLNSVCDVAQFCRQWLSITPMHQHGFYGIVGGSKSGKDGGAAVAATGKSGGRFLSSLFGKKTEEKQQTTPQKPPAATVAATNNSKQATPQHGPAINNNARQQSPALNNTPPPLNQPPAQHHQQHPTPQTTPPPPAASAPTTSLQTPTASAAPTEKKPSKGKEDDKGEDPKKSTSGKGKGLFGIFGRKKTAEEEKDKPKPMVLDSGPVKFDPKTGKFIFPETEEEKAIKAQIAAGPPPAPAGYKKMVPSSASVSPSAASMASPMQQPFPMMSPTGANAPMMMSPGGASMASVAQPNQPTMMMPTASGEGSPNFMMPSPNAPSPYNNTLRTPTGGMPPPPGMPMKRPPIPMANQYVDMFNS